MGKGGGHRHRQGRPIDTSFDSSFAAPAHRPQGFEPVCRRPRPTEERRQESRNGTRQSAALLQRRSLVATRSASLQPGFTSTKAKSLPRPYRFHLSPTAATKGTPPRLQKNPHLRSARAPPSTPASVKATRLDGFRPGGFAFGDMRWPGTHYGLQNALTSIQASSGWPGTHPCSA